MTILSERSDTPEKLANPKTQTGVVFRGPETGPCRAQDGLATGRSDEGWHQAAAAACRHRQNAYPALPACLPMPAQAGRRGECLPRHARASLPGTPAPLLRPIGASPTTLAEPSDQGLFSWGLNSPVKFDTTHCIDFQFV